MKYSVLLIILISSCSQDETHSFLTIKVFDEFGLAVPSANVGIFKSEIDANLLRNPIEIMTGTDLGGEARIYTKQKGETYILASKSVNCDGLLGRMENVRNVVKVNITPGLSNYFKITISPTGTLFYVNESINIYSLFLDSKLKIDIPGKSSYVDDFVQIGTHKIRVIQKDTFLLPPIDQTYQINVIDCETEIVNFPR